MEQNLINEILDKGYVLLPGRRSAEEYEQLGRRLGEVVLRTDVVVDASKRALQEARRKMSGRPSAFQSDALGFHSDNPMTNVIAFHCVRQDAVDGTLRLVDMPALLDKFSDAEIDELSCVGVSYTYLTGKNRDDEILSEPLVTRADGRLLIFYQSWMIRGELTVHQRQLLDRVAGLIEEAVTTKGIAIRLEQGQSLMVDNRRMLHGRGALPDDSKRHLVRLLIHSRALPYTDAACDRGIASFA